MMQLQHIFLIGARASGKTSLARVLSKELVLPMRDADAVFVERIGQSIAEFVEDKGWDAFRNMEAQILAELCSGEPLVVATGGGVVLRPENRALLKSSGLAVYLKAEADILLARLGKNPLPGQRPALTGLDEAEEIRKTLAEREPLYQECADLVLDADQPLDESARVIMNYLEKMEKA